MKNRVVFSLKSKMLLLAILPAVLITASLGLLFAYELKQIGQQQAGNLQQNLLAAKRAELKQYTDLALAAIRPIYEQAGRDDPQAQEQVKALLRRLSYGTDGYFFAYSADGPMVVHGANPTLEGKNALAFKDAKNNLFLQTLLDSVQTGDGYVTYDWDKPSRGKIVEKLSYGVMLEKWRWVLVTGFYIDDIEDAVQQSNALITQVTRQVLYFLLMVSGVILVAVILVGSGVARGILSSIRQGLTASDRLANGDLSTDLTVRRHDEIGQMLTAMNSVNGNLRRIVGEVQEAADQVSASASEIAQGSADLAHRTEEQASALEETASSMEELTGTVQQSAQNAKHASQLADHARQQAEQGGQRIDQMVAAMAAIDHSSRQIADIITVVDEIAFQTNLLALNAAVEAARAGEQGRGFAVVASEVRRLAQRSADAAKEIKRLINDSVNKVAAGSELVEQSGQTLGDIILSVKKVSDIVAEMAAASQEQASGIEQINQAILHMDQTTQQNAALVEQTAAASQAMGDQALCLRGLMGFFKLDTEVDPVPVDAPMTPRSEPVEEPALAPVIAIEQRHHLRPRRMTVKAHHSSNRSRNHANLPAKAVSGQEWKHF